MDHKVSKDMISSGMTPSGEKTQADLTRTQYGSAPSPSRLMDAYKSMYEHHQKDKDGNTIPHENDINEGKIPAGLQAFLDKKKGKKKDDGDGKKSKKGKGKPDFLDLDKDGDKKEPMKKASKEMKEGYKGTADLSKSHPEAKKKVEDRIAKHFGTKRVPGGKMGVKKEVKEENINELKSRTMLNYIDKASDSASKQLDKAEKTTSRKKEVKARLKMDQRERGIEMAKDKIMRRVKEETDLFDTILNHFINEGYDEKDIIQAMSSLTEEQLQEAGPLALLAPLLGKGAAAGAAAKGAAGAAGAAKITTTGGKVVSGGAAKLSNMQKLKQGVKTIAKNPMVQGQLVSTGTQAITQKGEKVNKTGQVSAQRTAVAASADLFDIVKGQLLDEGLSEEEIRDIMLALTPEEIMKEMNQGPSTPVKNYGEPGKPKILPNSGAKMIARVKTTKDGNVIKGGQDTGKKPSDLM
mgnify:CR=1 FL=1